MFGEVFAVNSTDEAFGLVRATIWFALIFALLAGGIALVRRYREHGSLLERWSGRTAQDADDPGALLTKFRELHSRGTLSDGEYRTIRTKLAAQIHANLDESPPEKSSEP